MFVPSVVTLGPFVASALKDTEEHRLLTVSISAEYERRRNEILTTAGVWVIAEGSYRADTEGYGWVRPTIVATDLQTLHAAGSALLDEAFGPLSILVEYSDFAELPAIAEALFPGNLTGTIFIADGEVGTALIELVAVLSSAAGRVLFNGWPTGVAVTPAMQHGGPWPATTTDATSVGTASIGRFLRGVAYQNAPDSILPPALQDANPWGIPRAVSAAGTSLDWGNGVLDARSGVH